MIILEKAIEQCPICKCYKGWVKERYNGTVPVYCSCGLTEQLKKYKRWKSPCMVCPTGDKFCWTPTTDHKEEDGRWWHTPYFSGPSVQNS